MVHEKRLRILGEEMNTEELKEVLQVSEWMTLRACHRACQVMLCCMLALKCAVRCTVHDAVEWQRHTTAAKPDEVSLRSGYDASSCSTNLCSGHLDRFQRHSNLKSGLCSILCHAAVAQQAQPTHGQIRCPGSLSCHICQQLSASGRSDCAAGASCQQQAARMLQRPRLAASLGSLSLLPAGLLTTCRPACT